jgi:uncharacterized protein YgiM (DUF1202 family)
MIQSGAVLRSLIRLTASLFTLVLCSRPVAAAELAVTAPESIVRSAPFDVAPEIGRVHAGNRLTAEDQAQGIWRRVQLPDGRWGFLHEAEIKQTSAPVPVAPTPATSAPGPAAPAATPSAVGGPKQVVVRVTALELGVRATAAAEAPISQTLHQNDEVKAFADLENGWRRIELSAGRAGFVSDAGVQVVETNASTSPGTVATAGVVAETPAVNPPDRAAPDSLSELTLLGAIFELLPVGRLSAGPTGNASSTDAASAVAIAPFLDVPLAPYVSLGISPQFIFGVKGSSASDSATEYDLRARLTGRYPLSPSARTYLRFSPGYSLISLPGSSSSGGGSNPTGLSLDFAVGAEVELLPKLVLVVDLGYQFGFQSSTVGDATSLSYGATVDFQTSYLHLGAGLAVGL